MTPKVRSHQRKPHGRVGDEQLAVRRWLRGQAAAAVRSRQVAARRGPDSRQAAAEALSAVNALAAMGMWPGQRDRASENAVIDVRNRWARIQKQAMRARRQHESHGLPPTRVLDRSV